MNLSSLLRVCLRALLRNKMRSALTMLGIIIGVAAVVSMVAITTGARTSVQTQISSLGDNVFMIFSGNFHRSGARMAAGTRNSLTAEDVDAIRQQSKDVHQITPTIRTNAQLVSADQNWSTSVLGVNPEYIDIRRYEIQSGRMFSDVDMRGASKVCVVGQTVITNLFNGNDPVGQTIRIRRLPFEVVGVLAAKGQAAMGQDQDDVVLIPFTTGAKKFQSGDTRVGMVFGSARDGLSLTSAQAEIRDILRARHQLGDKDDDDFTIRTQSDISKTVEASANVMTYLLGSVAMVSLLVGGIGIMNIMLVSVTERTREIGIRMSVGAREADILRQFLLEALLLSAIGGLIGVLLGGGVSLLISKLAGWPTQVSMPFAALALGFAAMVGIFFGFYPARKASRLDPIEALRYE
ncbi:ABC transporter permease [candidate division KSB1 bacterium]|nr:ABC transporter permease [candidate division KSB1 bacterium]